MSSFGLIDPKIIASLKEQSVLHKIGQKNFNTVKLGNKELFGHPKIVP